VKQYELNHRYSAFMRDGGLHELGLL